MPNQVTPRALTLDDFAEWLQGFRRFFATHSEA
jgi:hypothetical protein